MVVVRASAEHLRMDLVGVKGHGIVKGFICRCEGEVTRVTARKS